MNETLVSASTAGLVEMIQTWRWSNKFLESVSSLRSPSPLPPKPWKPSSWPRCWRPGVPAAVHGAQAALPHRRRPTWGGQLQGGIGPTCQTSSSQFSIIWIVEITVACIRRLRMLLFSLKRGNQTSISSFHPRVLVLWEKISCWSSGFRDKS